MPIIVRFFVIDLFRLREGFFVCEKNKERKYPMKYFVGIDQGGTKTDVLIGDENGKLLARHIGPGWDEDFFGVQISCAEDALKQCNLSVSDVYAFASSMTGIDNDDGQKWCENTFREKVNNERAFVNNDSFGTWRSATKSRPSCALAVGTATALNFFHENGTCTNVSDAILGEYQSGWALGHRAFERACASAIGFWESTALTENICVFAETKTLEEAFIKTDYGLNSDALSYHLFAPYVLSAAVKGDKVSIDIIDNIGCGLAGFVRAGIVQFGWYSRDIQLVLSGGVLKGGNGIMENVIREALTDIPNLTIFRAQYEPVYGALLLAYDEYNAGVDVKVSVEDVLRFNLKR